MRWCFHDGSFAVSGKDLHVGPGGGQAGPWAWPLAQMHNRSHKPTHRPGETRQGRPANWRHPGRHLKAKVLALNGKSFVPETVELVVSHQDAVASDLDLGINRFPSQNA